MLFSNKELKRLLPKKKPGRKKKIKRTLMWKFAWKILKDGGSLRHGKRVNSDDLYLKLHDKHGNALRILHKNTCRALFRKNRVICILKDHGMVANLQWKKKKWKVKKRKYCSPEMHDLVMRGSPDSRGDGLYSLIENSNPSD